jgi:hypothetical protein
MTPMLMQYLAVRFYVGNQDMNTNRVVLGQIFRFN